ncbi:MAG: UvrD-helicase domain-containing protein [Mogibacterium diversum]|uniref:ATP-dependent helicase n=1 Tax=Mogibacterium diversum TaxID=114527 RepID=UPI002045A6F8|nr:UvrD-helicase domain-containing protein [Mogibacterium diversum]UQF82167.1 MAG: UvrD-helicase domain-containing protein [Mogibacterium diversum]
MDLSRLNKEQQEAVKHMEGPLLILAGAGSGKTTMMTHRIAYMLEKGVSPYNILAVTFTNKAAGEMKDRIESLTGGTRGMWVMTFHAMCVRILRNHGEVLGFKNGFSIYDESDKKALLKRIVKDLKIDEKIYPVSYLGSVISSCKEAEEDPDDYIENNSMNFKAETVAKVYARYMEDLQQNNAMDFDDLLWNVVKLFEASSEVLSYYQERFKYIMVDEYQDTNYLQYKLIHALAEKSHNLCVVGDDDQCIYQWRGADIRNILDFEKDFPETKVIKLEQNYRSDANILDLANSVIANNRNRKAKELWTDRNEGSKITYRRLEDEQREAWYVGGEIQRLHDEEGIPFNDMAILYRKNAQSRPFEEKFSFRGIPYRVLGGTRFYDRKEIKDVMSYMHLVENPSDDVAMARIINEPKRGLGPKSLGGIVSYAKAYKLSIFEALKEQEVLGSLSRKSRAAVEDLVTMLDELGAEQDNMELSDIYDNLIRRSGYLTALEAENTVEADARIENILELRSVIAEFEEKAAGSVLTDEEDEFREERDRLREDGFDVKEPTLLQSFLERIALLSDIDNRDESEDAVVMMTLHSSKGLEFPVVFMPGMENGLFPGSTSMDDPSKMEEERRLCYVGITRAMRKLYLTGAQTRMLYGRTDFTIESEFMREMDTTLLEGDPTVAERTASAGGIRGDGGILGMREFKGRYEGSADGYDASFSKPFDALKFAKKQASKGISNEGFEAGDRIRHPKFGEGLLIDQDAKTLTIAFDSVGIKKLGKGFVKLTKVE